MIGKERIEVPVGENLQEAPTVEESTANEQRPHFAGLAPLSDDYALERITRMMNFFREGNMVDLRSKFYDDEMPREEILAMWHEEKAKLDLPEEILIQEAEWERKAGPKSGLKPWSEVKDDFAEYYVQRKPRANRELLDEAVEAAIDSLGLRPYLGRLRRSTIPEAAEKLPSTTNWGLPEAAPGREYTYDRDSEGRMIITLVKDRIPSYIALAEKMEADLNHLGWQQGNMSFRRTDMKGPELKDCSQRLIQGQPHSVTILEATYGMPITKLVQTIRSPGMESMYSESALDQAIFRGLGEAKATGTLFVGEDVKGWDKSAMPDLIDAAFDLGGRLFQASENRELLEKLCHYFKTSGLVTPDGGFKDRYGGVSSGSNFTLLFNGFMHVIARHYVELVATGKPYNATIVVKGDDGCSIYGSEEEFEKRTRIYYDDLNFSMNLEKQWLREGSTSFAKKVYIIGDDHGTPPSDRTVASMCGYEKSTPRGWVGADDSLRWISQVAPYVGTRFEDAIIRFTIKGDRYALGEALPGGYAELIDMAGGEDEVVRKLGSDKYEGAARSYDPRKGEKQPVIQAIKRIYAEMQS